MTRVGLLQIAWWGFVVGCGRERRCDDGVDNDSDGWEDCADQDCALVCGEQCANLVDDDANGLVDCADPACGGTCAVGPTGVELCDNASDDDGDWLVDCGDEDCDPLCDSDGDGWVDEALGGLDCDDDDFEVHPTATEIPYDGVDEDCDPSTPDDDVDADGFPEATDCDDDDSVTFPGADETCGDGVVNDCDRTGPLPSRSDCFGERAIATADVTILGSSVDDWAGYAISTAGDLDRDGFVDLVIGAYGVDTTTGAAYIVRGPVPAVIDLASASVKWVGESEQDWAGQAVRGGQDVTGDDLPDVLVGAQYDDQTGNSGGAVYVVRGGNGGTAVLDTAWTKILSEASFDQAGQALDMAGDVNADGAGDILIGSPQASKNGAKSGLVHVVYGPVPGPQAEVQLIEATYRLVGEQAGDNAGCAVARAGDLDGDGTDDVVLGACLSDRGGLDSGAAYQFSTHINADRLVSDANGAMVGRASGDALGTSLAGGDINNDGLADLVVAAPGGDEGGEDAGAVYIADGPATTSMNDADAAILGESEADRAGTSVAVIEDLDGDGFRELLVGAPGSDRAGADAGSAYVLFGPLTGVASVGDADVAFTGDGAYDFLGQAVAPAGDLDGDGWDDILLGAPYHDGLAPSGGAAYVVTFSW